MVYDAGAGTETTIGGSLQSQGTIPYSRGPHNQEARCTACLVAAAAPIGVWFVAFLASFLLGALVPTTADHLHSLEAIRRIYKVPDDDYEQARRQIVSEPDQALAVLEAVEKRAKGRK
jgi:hypothetical protein